MGRAYFSDRKVVKCMATRPLVCRLYPLGRHVDVEGVEFYTTLQGHPLSEGELTGRGTIADYVEAQGARPYIAAHNGYFQWLAQAYRLLDISLEEIVSKRETSADDVDLLDMDRTLR